MTKAKMSEEAARSVSHRAFIRLEIPRYLNSLSQQRRVKKPAVLKFVVKLEPSCKKEKQRGATTRYALPL